MSWEPGEPLRERAEVTHVTRQLFEFVDDYIWPDAGAEPGRRGTSFKVYRYRSDEAWSRSRVLRDFYVSEFGSLDMDWSDGAWSWLVGPALAVAA